jgi:hypothetical protein
MTETLHFLCLEMLKDNLDLDEIPISERGSPLIVFRAGSTLSIRLAERWLKLDRRLTAYRDRPAILDQWKFTNGDGALLDLNITMYPHLVESRTGMGILSLAFIDEETFLIKLSAGRIGTTFECRVDDAQIDRREGVLRLTGKIRRNIGYTTNGHLLRNAVEPHGQDAQLVNLLLVFHLTDPVQFWPRYPVPSVALDDPAYDPNRIWGGPTWVNENYLLIEGLGRSGFPDVARALRRSTLEMMCGRAGIYEYYHL